MLIAYKRSGVQFALRAIPLGGFVASPDVDDAHQRITADAEAVLETVELPYRRIDLCPGRHRAHWAKPPHTAASCRYEESPRPPPVLKTGGGMFIQQPLRSHGFG